MFCVIGQGENYKQSKSSLLWSEEKHWQLYESPGHFSQYRVEGKNSSALMFYMLFLFTVFLVKSFMRYLISLLTISDKMLFEYLCFKGELKRNIMIWHVLGVY